MKVNGNSILTYLCSTMDVFWDTYDVDYDKAIKILEIVADVILGERQDEPSIIFGIDIAYRFYIVEGLAIDKYYDLDVVKYNIEHLVYCLEDIPKAIKVKYKNKLYNFAKMVEQGIDNHFVEANDD